jgi:hydrogenase maturation protein HypF
LRVVVRGAVQGVGFRPFIFRLASELGLSGWVNNSPQGVFVEVEGEPRLLEAFLLRIESARPPRSFIQSLEPSWLDTVGYRGFEIRESDIGGAKNALVLPDIATCPDCWREIFDPHDRRYYYPFTNCTNCGPRFTIIESLPYDRANTSMRHFRMCPTCDAEYHDPLNRRFHAQPNACPECGPQVELWDSNGEVLGRGSRAVLQQAAQAIRDGKILALKGLGGFHLLVAAHNNGAVRLLRERKHREEKPFAVMFPSLEAVQAICAVELLEQRLLRSAEAPIVLLRRRSRSPDREPPLSDAIAPNNPNLGVLLPYTPLHHLLLAELGFAVVATSGNLSDEPICIDEHAALECLGGIADLFLVHNRPIVRHVDDSIVRLMVGRELVLRRARGYAPLPIPVRAGEAPAQNVLAVGAHLKNTVTLAVGNQAFVSQHIGDLETEQAHAAFTRVIADFETLYAATPEAIVADAHPDYLSTQYARARAGETASPRLATVQHHVAHVLSCMAENELQPPLLGVSWDGTGYGLDGTVWGGEFFLVTPSGWERAAHLRPFRLPGGDQAVKEPRRTALGLLYEMWGDTLFDKKDHPLRKFFSEVELASFRTMLTRGLNAPFTSSAGRLFDAVAALLGLRDRVRFEGQAAMELEFSVNESGEAAAYPFTLDPRPPRWTAAGPLPARTSLVVNWQPMVEALLRDIRSGSAAAAIASRFHQTLVEMILAVAQAVAQPRVLLSGGCFQNRCLAERAVRRLQQAGFQPYWHQRVPPNDGGISLGQVIALPHYKV